MPIPKFPIKSQLVWHLSIALILKILLLGLLWHHFIRNHKVHVDESVMGQRLAAQATPNSTGEKNDRTNGR